MSEWIPPLIHHQRDTLNGHYPAAGFYSRAIAAENFLTDYGDRCVFSAAWRLGQYGQFPDTTTTLRRHRFRSRYGAKYLRAVVKTGRAYNWSAGVGPPVPTTGAGNVTITVTLSGGGTQTLGPFASPEDDNAVPTDAPSTWTIAMDSIEIASASVYECAVVVQHYGRPLSVELHEHGDLAPTESVSYHNGLIAQAGTEITEATRSRLLIGLSNMYRQNGGTVAHWGLAAGTAFTRTSATFINLIDNATAAPPTAATPGWHLDFGYRCTHSRPTTVPFEFSVYGSVAAGAGGSVRIVNSAGTALATATITGAAGWYTATGLISTTAGKFDLQYAGDGANLLTVNAVSFGEWEA